MKLEASQRFLTLQTIRITATIRGTFFNIFKIKVRSVCIDQLADMCSAVLQLFVVTVYQQNLGLELHLLSAGVNVVP